MASITSLQAAMLKKMARSEYTELNGAEPESLADVGALWADCIIETQQDKGTYTSLIASGMVTKSSKGKDAAVGLTQLGFNTYKSL